MLLITPKMLFIRGIFFLHTWRIPLTQSAATLATTTPLLLQTSWLAAVTPQCNLPSFRFLLFFLIDWLNDCRQMTWRHVFLCGSGDLECRVTERMDPSDSDGIKHVIRAQAAKRELDLSSGTAGPVNNVKCFGVGCQHDMWSKRKDVGGQDGGDDSNEAAIALSRRQSWRVGTFSQFGVKKLYIHTYVSSLLSH